MKYSDIFERIFGNLAPPVEKIKTKKSGAYHDQFSKNRTARKKRIKTAYKSKRANQIIKKRTYHLTSGV